MQHIRPTDIQTTSSKHPSISPENSPISPRADRRKKRTAEKKTNEERIAEAHKLLIDYVDHIEKEVEKVVDGNEAQFLIAYRHHFKNVRAEMKEIKQKTVDALNDNQKYMDRIEVLQKEVILFREESLNLSEKNNFLNQDIQNLKFQIKQLEQDNFALQKSLTRAFKDKKETAVRISTFKQTKISHIGNNIHSFETAKKIKDNQSSPKQERPFTMSVRVKSRRVQLGLNSLKKTDADQLTTAPKKLNSEQKNEVFRKSLNRTLQYKEENESEDYQSLHHQSQRKGRVSHRFDKPKINTQKLVQFQIKKLRSQQLVNKNDYQQIFINCVEEVKKEILRRSGITGLNYFKSNGPKDFTEFKKIDYHLLLYLFLKNDQVIQAIHNLMFIQEKSL